MVKDVAVEVPVPENVIPDLIIPSHIVVPRCTGVPMICTFKGTVSVIFK